VKKIKCKNCANEFSGIYCNFCGQKANVSKIDLSYIVNQVQTTILQHDKGLFYTIRQLFTRPGHSIREYLEGKRVKHFKPLAYVLVLSTVYAFLNYFFGTESNLLSGMGGFAEGFNDYGGEIETSFSLTQWMIDNYAYGVLLLLPFYSLASYLAFKKSGYNYYEHIVVNSFILGQQTMVQILFVPLIKVLPEGNLANSVEALKFFLITSLVFWTYFQFFHRKRSLSKLLLILLSYIIMLVILLLLLIIGTRIPS